LNICVYMFTSMYVCVCVCVCVCVWSCVCVYSVCVCAQCVCVCARARMHASVCAHMHMCMCFYVCSYVCRWHYVDTRGAANPHTFSKLLVLVAVFSKCTATLTCENVGGFVWTYGVRQILPLCRAFSPIPACQRHTFSTVLSIVAMSSKCTRTLTFQNFLAKGSILVDDVDLCRIPLAQAREVCNMFLLQ